MKALFAIVVTGWCIMLSGCGSKEVPAGGNATTQVPVGSGTNPLAVDPSAQKELGFEVQPAGPLRATSAISATGQLQLNEDRTWKVGTVTEGRIVSVPVRLGESIKAGQVVAQMHSHAVHDARADRRQAVAELEKLKVIAEQARRVRDRTRRLFELKAASKEQLEAAETQSRSSEFSVTNAEAEVQKADSHLTEFLEVPLQDGDHKPGKPDDHDQVPIKTPAAGTVIERLANVGSVVSVATPVVTISDLTSVWLIAAVNEADLSQIRRGQAARITVRAYPDRTFTGRVFELGERMDAQTRTLQVRVLVANAGGLLKPDMYASVEFAAAGPSQSIYVPESAVQELNGKFVVFVQSANKAFTPREVRTGVRAGGRIEILSGLESGDPVVVKGALLLKSELLKGEGS